MRHVDGKQRPALPVLLVWGCATAVALAGEFPAGPLKQPQATQVVVEKLPCDCESESGVEGDVLLLTVGTESVLDGQRHFHPIVSVAFDRLLAEEETGQWVALWSFGGSPAGWRRTLRSFFPIPGRAPKASPKQLAQLAAQLEQLHLGQHRPGEAGPEPDLDWRQLKHATTSQGAKMALKRVLNWLDVFNPAQLFLRTYLLHRDDRDERLFQRTYLGLVWLIDVEFDGDPRATAWLDDINDVRFHLLRNRSFFGRWVRHSDSYELVYNYDSKVREQLGKGSSWLQADANEYHLRYEAIHRYTVNSATVPVAGILYYDPRTAPAPEYARWPTPNVFDLGYNPFTHPEVQRRAQENPDQLIPLALYAFQSELGLRPIIVADFFEPNNPRVRESTQQGMAWLREWLFVSSGFLSAERIAYRVGSYVANKKAFTLLANKSARLGVEELRFALESHLYFTSELRPELMRRVDKRVLNPLVKAAEVEALLAELQYEGLRAEQARAVCQAVNRVRRKMAERFGVPSATPAPERWLQLRARLAEWQARRRVRDLSERGLEELGTLAALEEQLGYFENHVPSDAESARVLGSLYAAVFQQELGMPAGSRHLELGRLGQRVAQAWAEAEAARGRSPEEFEQERARVESAVRARQAKEERKREKERVRSLRDFLNEAHEHFKRAGCAQSQASPADVEMYLEALLDLSAVLPSDPLLQREFRKHEPRLQCDLARLQKALAQCPPDERDPWRFEQRQATLLLARAADGRLFATRTTVSAVGEE